MNIVQKVMLQRYKV